jgi:multiple sugar transport system substrate-binding protein
LSFGDPYDWQNWFVMGGGDYLSPDGTTMKGYFDSQGAIDTMKFLTDMVLVDKVSPSPSILSASGGTYAMFSSGKLGMIHSGMWFLGYLSSRGLPADDYGTVIVPSPKGRQPVTMMNTSGWAMAAACKNKKEAVEVLKFLADEGGKTQGEAGWAFPVSEKAIKETGLLDDPVTRVFHDSLQYALESPGFLRTPDYMEKCSQYVSEAFDLVLLGKATPEEAMKQAVAKSEKAFER